MLANAGQISREAGVKALASANGIADVATELDAIDQDIQ